MAGACSGNARGMDRPPLDDVGMDEGEVRPVAAVLAPTPQLTITVEEVGDQDDIHLHAGGQGVWQARMLAALGLEVRLCGFFAGEAGTVARALVADEHVRVHDVAGNGTSGAYVHDRRGGERETLASMPPTAIDRHELDDLYGRFLVDALAADVVLLGGPDEPGVIPADLYRRLAADLRANGKLVVADVTGGPQGAVLESGISVLKVSDEELDMADEATEDVVAAARSLAERGADQVIVTRVEQPSIAIAGAEGWSVEPPSLHPVDHRGAGDSFTAAYAASLARGRPPEHALRHAAAAGALNVTRHGLASGERDRIEALAEQVEIRPLSAHDEETP